MNVYVRVEIEKGECEIDVFIKSFRFSGKKDALFYLSHACATKNRYDTCVFDSIALLFVRIAADGLKSQ